MGREQSAEHRTGGLGTYLLFATIEIFCAWLPLVVHMATNALVGGQHESLLATRDLFYVAIVLSGIGSSKYLVARLLTHRVDIRSGRFFVRVGVSAMLCLASTLFLGLSYTRSSAPFQQVRPAGGRVADDCGEAGGCSPAEAAESTKHAPVSENEDAEVGQSSGLGLGGWFVLQLCMAIVASVVFLVASADYFGLTHTEPAPGVSGDHTLGLQEPRNIVQ